MPEELYGCLDYEFNLLDHVGAETNIGGGGGARMGRQYPFVCLTGEGWWEEGFAKTNNSTVKLRSHTHESE